MWTVEAVKPRELLDSLSEADRERVKTLILEGQKYFAMAVLHEQKRWTLHAVMDAVLLFEGELRSPENPRRLDTLFSSRFL